jgi:uncharacterized protein YbjT (DUF2867 family)
MYAIMDITGPVGSAAAKYLLERGERVRGIVRGKDKAAARAVRGVDLVVADATEALAAAFAGTEGVFVALPAGLSPGSDFAESRALIDTLAGALRKAQPPKVVALSSIGAQHSRELGQLTPLHLLEQALDALPLPRAHVRPAWFMENLGRHVTLAQLEGRLESFLSPLDRAIPMVSTDDVGRTVASTLEETWFGRRLIEVEGPRRYSALDMAQSLAAVLEHDVETGAIPRGQWAARLADEGMPADRIAQHVAMLDGFNSGWIAFEKRSTEHVCGRIPLGYVADELVCATLDVLESAA